MPNELQTKLSAAVKRAEEIFAGQSGKPAWDPQAVVSYEAAVTEARGLKTALEQQQALEAVKLWQAEPDGEGAVQRGFTQSEGIEEGGAMAGWSGEAVHANEGNMPGVTMTGLIEQTTLPNGTKSFKAGEMYALDKRGEAKLKTLKSGGYKDAFADYIKNAAFHGSDWRYHMKSGAMKVLLEGQDTAGGFWTPPDIRSELVKKMASIVGIRQNAFSFTTGSNLVQFPKLVYNAPGASGDTAANIYTAGTIPSWTAEGPSSDINEATNPISGRVSIPVNTATVAVIITRALIEDSMFDILGYISSLLGESYGLFEDNAFINGTGAGQPWGFMNHPNATVASTSNNGMYVPSGDASKLLWEATSDPTKGILGIEGALPPQYEGGAKWYATKAGYSYIRGILDQNLRPLWLPADSYPNFANGYMATLLGYSTVKDQFMPAVGSNNYPIAFGDMQGYYIPDRVGLSVQVLNELRALRDEVVVYARKRVGGQLVHDWKLKLQKVAVS